MAVTMRSGRFCAFYRKIRTQVDVCGMGITGRRKAMSEPDLRNE